MLVPCYNEEKSLKKAIESWVTQTRAPDEIIVVDDSSSDKTPEILKEFEGKIRIVRTPKNLGNKSHAQEYGLQFVTGEIFVCTDADTILAPDFVERMEKDFEDPEVAAVGGYIKSLQYNWLTRNRAFEYSVCQNIHKLAQSQLNFMFVIPGAAGAFRTEIFRKYLSFDHDTLTEDLDFTYKMHKFGLKILYDLDAVVYTQDPVTLGSYINQIRRWFAGGWQNVLKHYKIALRPTQALELSLMYIEGLVFSLLIFLVPLINIRFVFAFTLPYFILLSVFAIFTAIKERRWDLLLAPFPHMFLAYVSAYVLLEQFVKEIILRRKHLLWFKPERV